MLPHPEIAPLASERLVGLAADCDDPEPEVIELAEQLEDAYMLPFVIFVDADGRFLQGSSGGVNPLTFRKTLLALPQA